MPRLIATIGLLGLAVDSFLTVRRLRRHEPFGPFMVAGSLFALFLGAPLADTYVRPALRA